MHLLGEMMSQEADIKLNHVPYKGSVPSLNDLIGGNIDVAISTLATVIPFLKTGRLKVLALAEPEPSSLAPDVPLVKDTLPGLTAPAWFAFVAPAGTPPEILDKLYKAADKALAGDKVQQGLQTGGM